MAVYSIYVNLCPIFLKIIPEEFTSAINYERNEDDVWNVEDLVKFLQVEVENHLRKYTFLITFRN